MKKSNNDQMKFVDRFPAFSEQVETHISIFINIGMQYFVETFNLRWFDGIFIGCGVRESDSGIPIDRSLSIGDNNDVKISD